MNYKIVIEKPAQKFIAKQQLSQQKRILAAIKQLPDHGDIKVLKGSSDLFRLRVGDFRILYSVHNDLLIIRIIHIGNRGDIYKSF
ncbi:MAG: type II toxin-antitoxin system RelE/ParE family toxin [Clostridia bacterium]|nr:type II toxin-antitoxin system RelE/ParE family toxin [Clostridia bacterium]